MASCSKRADGQALRRAQPRAPWPSSPALSRTSPDCSVGSQRAGLEVSWSQPTPSPRVCHPCPPTRKRLLRSLHARLLIFYFWLCWVFAAVHGFSLAAATGGSSLLWWASLVAHMIQLPAREETSVRSLGREDPLEEGMATHSSVLAWRNPWTEEPGGLQSMRSQRVRRD